MATPFVRTNGATPQIDFGTPLGGVATLACTDSPTNYTITFQAADQTVPVGTCSVNQVLVGSGTNTHASSPNFTFDGTTLYANAKLNLGAVTNASPVDGDLWYDTTKKTFAFGVNGATSYLNDATSYLSGVIFTQTDSRTIGNTLGDWTIFAAGIGSTTLPPNFLTAGRSIRMRAYGYISTGAETTSATLRIKFGSYTILTSTGSLPSGLSNALVEFDFTFSCRRRAGDAAVVIGQGSLKITPSAAFASSVGMALIMTGETSMNATMAITIDVRYQWGTPSASTTITITNATIEVLA